MAFTNTDVDNILTEVQRNVIKADINSDVFYEDMIRRMQYGKDNGCTTCLLIEKYEKSFERLKKKWEPILVADGVDPIPTDEAAFAALVFAHDDYKDKKAIVDAMLAEMAGQ